MLKTLGKFLEQIAFVDSIIRMILLKQIAGGYVFRPSTFMVEVAHLHSLHHYLHLFLLPITNPFILIDVIF